MKHLSLYFTLVCLIGILLWACQKDSIIPGDTDFQDNAILKDHSNGHGGNNGNGNGNNGNTGNLTYVVDLEPGHISGSVTSTESGSAQQQLFVAFNNGKVSVLTSDGILSYGPSFSVNVNSDGIPDNVQFWIREAGGKNFPLYSTGPIDIVPGEAPDDDFIVHLDYTVDLWRLKKWNGGPQEEVVGTVTFGDLHFVLQ